MAGSVVDVHARLHLAAFRDRPGDVVADFAKCFDPDVHVSRPPGEAHSSRPRQLTL